MLQYRCPVCGGELLPGESAWRCGAGHSFDRARQGYVNLLPVTQKHSKRPGDTQEQVSARRAFLRAGYYAPIAQAVCEILAQVLPPDADVLDAGCGEGYYLGCLQERLPGIAAVGLDISKEAVRAAAGQNKQATWLVGTAAHLPLADHCLDAVLSLFALTAQAEFHRVLRPGGVFLQALAGENHLMAIKRIIYPEILHREKTLMPEFPGFSLEQSQTLRFPVELECNDEVMALLSMTPHIYRISAEGLHRAQNTQTLRDEAEVVLNLYRAMP